MKCFIYFFLDEYTKYLTTDTNKLCMCIICIDKETDHSQWEPAEPLFPVVTGFYGQEDEWLPVAWKQKIKI